MEWNWLDFKQAVLGPWLRNGGSRGSASIYVRGAGDFLLYLLLRYQKYSFRKNDGEAGDEENPAENPDLRAPERRCARICLSVDCLKI